MEWYVKVLKKYAEFSGRAQRAEYWMFLLFNMLIAIVLYGGAMAFMDSTLGGLFMALYGLYALGTFIPGLAVLVRRLHDTNRSGFMMFIALIPLVGPIILLVFLASDSTPGPNQYGPNPKALPMR